MKKQSILVGLICAVMIVLLSANSISQNQVPVPGPTPRPTCIADVKVNGLDSATVTQGTYVRVTYTGGVSHSQNSQCTLTNIPSNPIDTSGYPPSNYGVGLTCSGQSIFDGRWYSCNDVATFLVTPPPPEPMVYTLTNGGSIIAGRGQAGSTTVTKTHVSGSVGSITLSASGLPGGSTLGISNNPSAPTSTSLVTIIPPSYATPGRYPITITGTGGRSTNFDLHVVEPFDYVLTNPANPTTTRGSGGGVFTHVGLTSGTAQPVTLSASVPHPSIGVTIHTNPVTPTAGQGTSVTITYGTTAQTPTGDHIITITGQPLGKTAQFTLTVNAVPSTFDFTLQAHPASANAPLNDVDFTVVASGSATGNILYELDCDNNGLFEHTRLVSVNSYPFYNVCDYATPDVYTAKMRATREGISVTKTVSISVTQGSAGNICGDGVLNEGVEECDDGNTINYDGCSQICTAETCSVPNLVGYWRFDESAGDAVVDSTSSDNVGLKLGSPTPASGIVGNALDFDGVDDRVLVRQQSNTLFNSIQGTDSRSYNIWVKFHPWYTWPSSATIFATGGGSNAATSFRKAQSAYRVAVDTTVTSTGSSSPISESLPSWSDSWHMLTVVQEKINEASARRLRLYFDGSLVVDRFTWANVGADDLWIGFEDEKNGQNFRGLLDEFSIWNKALTLTDIQDLYQGGSGKEICALPQCGDGVVNHFVEECDDGNLNDADSCSNQCETIVCGDGRVMGNEVCDDGNTASGDGCDSSCQVEQCSSDGLEIYYKFEGNAGSTEPDYATSRNGIVANSPVVVSGINNNALQFDKNADQYIQENGRVSDTQVSYAGWFKPSELNDNFIMSFLSDVGGEGANPNSGFHHRGHIRILPSLKLESWHHSYHGGCNDVVTTVTSTDNVINNQWNHFVVTIDFANNMRSELYLNGKLQGSYTAPQGCLNDQNIIWIGRKKSSIGSHKNFHGSLDEFSVWDKVLSANEVSYLFAGGFWNPSCRQGSVCGDGTWDFDEECDDGNADNTDHCKIGCARNVCGDGFVLRGVEQCDGHAECESATCAWKLSACPKCNNDCGVGIFNVCDQAECEALGPCTFTANSYFPGGRCDAGVMCKTFDCSPRCVIGDSNCCGNRVLDSGEQCDDGNNLLGDGCSPVCQDEFCGDGIVQKNGKDGVPGNADDEECEPLAGADICDNECKLKT